MSRIGLGLQEEEEEEEGDTPRRLERTMDYM